MNTNPPSTATTVICRLCCAAVMVTFTSCATSGSARVTRSLPAESKIISTDRVNTEVLPSTGVTIADADRSRFANQIASQIRAKAHPGNRGGRDYRVIVKVTRYERGSAFARAMLAGLGQMHIDGTVAVHTPPAAAPVGEFTISKTFAWGGMVGASTRIETVEGEFAKAVAEAVAGSGGR